MNMQTNIAFRKTQAKVYETRFITVYLEVENTSSERVHPFYYSSYEDQNTGQVFIKFFDSITFAVSEGKEIKNVVIYDPDRGIIAKRPLGTSGITPSEDGLLIIKNLEVEVK